MKNTFSAVGEWIKETLLENPQLHHYLALGMLTLWILVQKGNNLMAIEISTLFFVCLIVFVMCCVGIGYLTKMLRTKSGRKEIKAKIDDLEHFIADVKDDIANDDMTIQSASDEGLRRMAKLQKDQHVAKLTKFQQQVDSLKSKLSACK